MIFKIKKELKQNIITAMREVGYNCLGCGSDQGEYSFVRSREKSGFPRFHVFVKLNKGKYPIFDIHLDQKKESYKGSRAHNAIYDGIIIEEEVERIINKITP